MIKANELRIGNWVYMGKIPARVSQIKEDYCWTDEAGSGMYVFVEPIPLTAEILEKSGFVLNTFDECQIPIDSGLFSCVPKKLYFSGDYLYLEEWRGNVKSHDRDIVVIWNKDIMKQFNLHQLQNLYFALTGTELNISL